MAADSKKPSRRQSPLPATTAIDQSRAEKIFAGLFGALLGLSIVKFGNAIILEKMIDWPKNEWEWAFDSWPPVIGNWLLAGLAIFGLLIARSKKGLPQILVLMPAMWMLWQIIATSQTSLPHLSVPTTIHFGACVVCFYLGLFSLNGVQRCWPFWVGIFGALFIMVCSGFQQHFGGLEQSQKYWMLYIYPTLKEVPPDLMKKMSSRRIFATLFYPNSLAGEILLLFPAMLAVIWSLREKFTSGARVLLLALGAGSMLACLYWSGSKAGWLLMLVIAFVGAMYLPMKRQAKVALVVTVLILGLGGFAIKNLAYFKKGATSVNARFDYWEAAWKIARANPIFGNGPGTFSQAYERIKRPESEMAKVAHNDYLEQASDSGIPGFLTYAIIVVGILYFTWRHAALRKDWIRLAVWLGLLGWGLQSFVEFGLYIPAIAWVAFALMGWLLGQCERSTTRP